MNLDSQLSVTLLFWDVEIKYKVLWHLVIASFWNVINKCDTVRAMRRHLTFWFLFSDIFIPFLASFCKIITCDAEIHCELWGPQRLFLEFSCKLCKSICCAKGNRVHVSLGSCNIITFWLYSDTPKYVCDLRAFDVRILAHFLGHNQNAHC